MARTGSKRLKKKLNKGNKFTDCGPHWNKVGPWWKKNQTFIVEYIKFALWHCHEGEWQWMYGVHWFLYSENQDTVEPESVFDNPDDMLNPFWASTRFGYRPSKPPGDPKKINIIWSSPDYQKISSEITYAANQRLDEDNAVNRKFDEEKATKFIVRLRLPPNRFPIPEAVVPTPPDHANSINEENSNTADSDYVFDENDAAVEDDPTTPVADPITGMELAATDISVNLDRLSPMTDRELFGDNSSEPERDPFSFVYQTPPNYVTTVDPRKMMLPSYQRNLSGHPARSKPSAVSGTSRPSGSGTGALSHTFLSRNFHGRSDASIHGEYAPPGVMRTTLTSLKDPETFPCNVTTKRVDEPHKKTQFMAIECTDPSKLYLLPKLNVPPPSMQMAEPQNVFHVTSLTSQSQRASTQARRGRPSRPRSRNQKPKAAKKASHTLVATDVPMQTLDNGLEVENRDEDEGDDHNEAPEIARQLFDEWMVSEPYIPQSPGQDTEFPLTYM